MFMLSSIAICFEFWNLQYFQLEYYYLFLLFFLFRILLLPILFLFFVDLVDLCFLVTTRQPNYLGGAHVCVFGLF